MLKINTEIVKNYKDEDVVYYSFTTRGVLYTLHYSNIFNYWEIISNRLSYSGGAHGIKFFDTIEELESNYKSLRGISKLISDPNTTQELVSV